MASYLFGGIDPEIENFEQCKDEFIKLKRSLQYFAQNLNHHNVKQLYTEYCDIQSEGGETVIDGPLILMYSATDSTTLRLEMGYDSSEFVFRLYNNGGTPTVYIDSSGNAVFLGHITASQITGSTITGGQITGSTISGAQITASTLTASQITASSISGSYIYGSTIEGGQITGSCIASSFNIHVGERLFLGSTAALAVDRGVYFSSDGAMDAALHIDSCGSMRLNSTAGICVYNDISGDINFWQVKSGGKCNIIMTDSSGGTKYPFIIQTSGVTNTFGLIISDGNAYFGGTASSNILGKKPYWLSGSSVSLSWTGGPPSAISKDMVYSRVGDMMYIQFYLASSDGNGVTALQIGIPENCTAAANLLNAQVYVNSTYFTINAVTYYSSSILFTQFPTWTDNKWCEIKIGGYIRLA